MVNVVVDTTLLIDYLNQISAAADELDRYDQVTISIISWIEVMAGVKTPAEEVIARDFLSTFTIANVEPRIATRAAMLRRSSRLRVPDAIIQATAQELGQLLVTRNSKDFPPDDPGVRIPYQV